MLKQRTPLPGFGLSLGITVFYLGVMVLLPLAALFATSGALPWESFARAAGSPRALAAFRLTVGTSALAAALNVFFGGLTAWALVRYRFPGKKIIDGLIDLPFALPTAVAGITLTELCAPTGWLGRPLAALGLPVAFSRAGIVIALVFIGLPFVVRTLQPVLEDMDRDMEEAASTLGAGRWQIFRRVVFPPLVPALLTGFALTLARGIGEYGSVIFIAGNMPLKTEIVPLLIMTRLEQYDTGGAAALATVLLLVSFVLLFSINALQAWARRRQGASA
ncbi:MAG: sulfate ABC transporter permease subunit CysT [Elusimicrobia bacterium]|nr:sulfate ABC transporter permease subunit CysT [Elusimicrobiota bacterium]MBK7207780.1 sulfate ABC transporter permease subunit CysT [Elusimicrobiota bacterium]MBK7544542.1 sulfate ABC transporter permease subunit CysT [Elusimicrobiota bacterium]MBK7574067.1 sulfate ABC transporter permease subunit CysT [Elusimicrobiota bacterium]MBK7688986.1 sulfate ABC transporter permease subunit CysT [Elusimicrobiota bacterium]